MRTRTFALALALAGALTSCVLPDARPPLSGPIRLGSHEFLPPPGEGWTSRVDLGSGEALFINVKDPPWHGAGYTMIRVNRSGPLPPGPLALPASLAFNAFAEEELRLSLERRQRLTDVRKDILAIGDKTLYRLSFRLLRDPADPSGEACLARAERYLYFPADFSRTRVYYGFLVVDVHHVGVFGERGSLSSLRPLIESFHATPEPAPVERPPAEITP